MLNTMSRLFLRTPRRMVQAGLSSFFAGTFALLCAALAEMGRQDAPAAADLLAERFPALPTWFVPETPTGFTMAAMLVCWGVWAMGAALRQGRDSGGRGEHR